METATRCALALSQFTTGRQSFRDDLDLVQRCGWQALEVCENKLSDDPARAEDELKMLCNSGLSVCSVQARVHAIFPDQMAPEPADPVARVDAFCRTMDRFIDALPHQKPTFVLISGRAPDHNLGRAREMLGIQCCRLAEEAAQRGCRIAFEPLNPILINEDTFITGWDEAVSLAELVDRDSFGLVCDVWNVWQQPEILGDVHASIERVFLIHVSDWRDGGPRRLNDRLPPGEGVIPLAAWAEMLREARYSGPVCLEMLSDDTLDDSYYGRPMDDVLRTSRRALETAGWLEIHANAIRL
jgi:sugar phosphate isomerase/epimerase